MVKQKYRPEATKSFPNQSPLEFLAQLTPYMGWPVHDQAKWGGGAKSATSPRRVS